MSTQIAALPDAPAATDPVDTFDAKAFAFNAALQAFRTQANAMALEMQINADVAAELILAMALPQFAGTSTSSVTVGTGTRTFETQAGKGWLPGQIVVATSGANYVKGTVTAYTDTDLELNVTSINGSGTYAAWDIGLSYDGLELAKAGDNPDITRLLGLLEVPAVIAAAIPHVSPVRQTVRAGAATRLAIGTGLAVNLLATATPIRIAFAAGSGPAGDVDYVGTLSANVAGFWSGLTSNVINYLFYDRNPTTGAITGVASVYPYIVQDSDTAISTVSGQHTYVHDIGQMYVGNGSAAIAVQRTAEGECLAGASSITSVTSYQKNRKYKSAWASPLPAAGVAVNANHNIGSDELRVKLEAQCISAEFGYSVGQTITEINGNTGGVAAPISVVRTSKTVGFTVTNSGGLLALNKSTGANATLTPGSWKYRLVAEGDY